MLTSPLAIGIPGPFELLLLVFMLVAIACMVAVIVAIVWFMTRAARADGNAPRGDGEHR